MQSPVKGELVSVADYLAAGEAGRERREYLGGFVYPMAVESRAHDQIAQNLLSQIRLRTKGGLRRVYAGDIRVNLKVLEDEYYYCPDIVVSCDKRDIHPRIVHYPRLIIEVLSESTERVDRREKLFAYASIESLEEYALVAQGAMEVTSFRREEDWKAEKVSGDKAMLNLASLNTRIPLVFIYEGV